MPTQTRIKRIRLSQRAIFQFQVTIPMHWLNEHDLGEGDFVDLMKDADGRLIVVPVKAPKS